MTNASSPNESEHPSPFFSGWRKILLWAAGAAALGIAGYRGTLGTETAAAAPPPITAPTATAATTSATPAPPPPATPPNTVTAPDGEQAAPDETAAPTPPREGDPPREDDPPREGDPPREADSPREGGPRHETRPPGDTDPPHPCAAEPATNTARPSAPAPTGSGTPTPTGSGPAAITPDGKVVLNLATEAELRKLPGIGKSRARAIVAQRERVGRFRRIEDLLRIKGIGRKRLASLRSRLVLDAP